MTFDLNRIHDRVLHVVGPKNSGKTTLVRFLIEELTTRGFRVGSIKHSSHNHPVDKPGSDSDLFRIAGAHPSLFATPEAFGLYYPRPLSEEDEEIVETLRFLYRKCDVLLVESFREAKGRKIYLASPDEILSEKKGRILGVVNNEARHRTHPAFAPGDPGLADLVQGMPPLSIREPKAR